MSLNTRAIKEGNMKRTIEALIIGLMLGLATVVGVLTAYGIVHLLHCE